jgi:hypothetical protein
LSTETKVLGCQRLDAVRSGYWELGKEKESIGASPADPETPEIESETVVERGY